VFARAGVAACWQAPAFSLQKRHAASVLQWRVLFFFAVGVLHVKYGYKGSCAAFKKRFASVFGVRAVAMQQMAASSIGVLAKSSSAFCMWGGAAA
jgi:hypothetical protein